MPGFVDATIQDLDRRLAELRDECRRLEAARAALAGSGVPGPGRPRRTATASDVAPKRAVQADRTTARRRGRPQRRDTRAGQVLAMVRKSPGITIPQLAEQLKIKPNYLYRVLPALTKDGLVTKDGKGLYPVTDGSQSTD